MSNNFLPFTLHRSEMAELGFVHTIKILGDFNPKEIQQWIENMDVDCYVSCDEGTSIIAFNREDDAISFKMKFDTVVDNNTDFLGVKYEKVKEARTSSR